MSDLECKNERVARDGADVLRVRDAMVKRPKTVPAEATVADLRRVFENAHVVSALVVDGPEFVGMVHRDAVANGVADSVGVRSLVVTEVATIEPDAPLTDALAGLDSRAESRLVVLDPDGRTLRGLLCLTHDRNGFCQS